MALLTIGDLLADPTLGLRLVAGAGGLDRRGPIRWAHVSEIPDPTAWLDGGELLLTTGLAVRDSADLQRQFAGRLSDRGCVGIGYGVGIWTDEVPEALLAEADARGLPLFTVPYEVPFVAIARRIAQAVFADHFETLRAAVELHQRIAGAVLGGRGLEGVLAALARHLPGFDLIVLGYHGAALATRAAGAGAPRVDARALWEAITPAWRLEPRVSVTVDGHRVHAARVRVGDEVEAALVLVGEADLSDGESLMLTQGLTGVGLELARGWSIRESRRLRVDAVLDEVAEGMLTGQALARRLQRLGLERGPVQVLAVRQAGELPRPGLAAFVEDVLSASPVPSVVGRLDDVVYAVTLASATEAPAALAAAISSRAWTDVGVGLSRVKPGLEGVPTALREARRAVVAGQAGGTAIVTDIRALDVDGVVAGLESDLELEAFVHDVLGPLLAHAERDALPLLDTLRAYLAHGCRPGPAAAELCIHRHTLTYRLDRVAELTGRNLRDGDDLLALGFALRVLSRLDSRREGRDGDDRPDDRPDD